MTAPNFSYGCFEKKIELFFKLGILEIIVQTSRRLPAVYVELKYQIYVCIYGQILWKKEKFKWEQQLHYIRENNSILVFATFIA